MTNARAARPSPASQTRDKDALTEDGVARVINSLKQMFDWVICDSPAGIERGATLAMRFADTAIVVTNPEVSSVRDSDRIIGILDAKTVKAERGERVDKHLLFPATMPPAPLAGKCSASKTSSIFVDAVARHHPRKRGSPARFEPRLAGNIQQSFKRSGPSLSRCRAAAHGRRSRNDGSDRKTGVLRQTVRAKAA